MKIACYAAGSVGTNNYVVSDDNGITAIIDCDGNPAPLYSYIEKNNLKVTHILLTHGHYDHTGSVNEVAEHYGCTIVGCAKEMRVFTDPSINCSHFCCGDIIVHPDVLVNNGDVVKVGDMEFEVLETPGHTEGSICYICKDTIFSGDTLFRQSIGRTDFPGGSMPQMRKSLTRLNGLSGDLLIYPGHNGASTLEYEKEHNPYLRDYI